jgi:hypothetical protein
VAVSGANQIFGPDIRLGLISEVALGHIDAGGAAMVSMIHYDVNDYLAEKRRALELWARVLLKIVGDRTLPTGMPGVRPMFVESHAAPANDNMETLDAQDAGG